MTVPCDFCGTPTFMTGTRHCDACHNVVIWLGDFLRTGPKAIEFVRSALAKAMGA